MMTADQAFAAVYDLLLTQPINSAFREAADGPEDEPPPVDGEMLVAIKADRFALLTAIRELRTVNARGAKCDHCTDGECTLKCLTALMPHGVKGEGNG